MTATNAAELAAHRFLAVLNSYGDPAAVEAAFTEGGVIDRYGVIDDAGRVAEVIAGHAAISRWGAMCPPDTTFTLASPVSTETDERGPVTTVRYRVTMGPNFTNTGTWRFRLEADGRLAWLSHQPDELGAKRRS